VCATHCNTLQHGNGLVSVVKDATFDDSFAKKPSPSRAPDNHEHPIPDAHCKVSKVFRDLNLRSQLPLCTRIDSEPFI